MLNGKLFNMISTELILLFVYFIILLSIGYFSSKKEEKEDYLIANRKLSGFAIALSIAASYIGGNAIVNITGFVYTYGAAMFWATSGTILGFIVVIPMAKKMRQYTEENKFYTLPDYLSFKYGKRTGIIATLIIMIWYLMSLCVQFIAGATVIQSISQLDYTAAMLLMSIIVLVYLFLGGFKAVVRTDIFQYLLFIILFIVALFSISHGTSIDFSSFIDFKKVGFVKLSSFSIIAMGFVITAPELWQRVYAGKNKRETIKGLTLTSIFVLITYFFIAILGIAAKSSFPNIRPEQAALLGLNRLLPPALKSIGIILFFAVIMSTIDTLLFIIANNFSNDIWKKFINKEINLVQSTKISLVIFTVVLVVITLLYRDILALGLSMLSIGLSFAPILIGSFYFELKPKAVNLALFCALLSVILMLSFGIICPETSIISLPVSLILLLIGQVFFKGTPKN